MPLLTLREGYFALPWFYLLPLIVDAVCDTRRDIRCNLYILHKLQCRNCFLPRFEKTKNCLYKKTWSIIFLQHIASYRFPFVSIWLFGNYCSLSFRLIIQMCRGVSYFSCTTCRNLWHDSLIKSIFKIYLKYWFKKWFWLYQQRWLYQKAHSCGRFFFDLNRLNEDFFKIIRVLKPIPLKKKSKLKKCLKKTRI